MDPNELVNRAEQERIQIFQRYKIGRTKDAEIDSWEDPEFSVYFQTDRYGFIHDQKLPLAVDPNEKKIKSIEMERVNKWLKMLKNWDTKQTKEKMHKRVHKGIPDKLRSKVWAQLLNLEKVMKDPKNKNKYQEMLVLAQKYSTEARQIDSDVNRQFRDHIIYRERYNIKQQSLFNVLVAYSMYNMEVGYCQGMSTLAGMLLMYMDEEESFWGLSILLSDKKFAMHGLFIVGFPKLSRFLAHHDHILTKFLPKVKKHFDSCNLDSILYSLKWFFVVFVERIPFALCLRVWDIYLMDGEKVVTAMAYTILRLHKTKLLKLRDMDSIVHYLQVKLQHDFGFSDDFVIKMLEQCSEELRKAKLDLPATATEIELPQKPFGVFVEPTKEEKIGHRKSDFTSIEKEVTETVLLKRELTAIELANEDNHLEEIGLCGSNSQLNTVQISEDGGSLLGSSKRSLADTSVTSTADLSVFSGTGQRSMSQQHNDFGFDNSLITNDNNNLNSSDIDLHIIENNNNNKTNNNGDDDDEDEDVENGESSPNSVAKSTSTIQIYQKPVLKIDEPLSIENSSLTHKENIIPTPTNISPQDIVRIYVPPADPVELREQKVRADDELSQSSRRSSIIRLEYDITPLESSPPHRSRNASQPHSPQSYRGEQVTTSNKQHNDKTTYSPTSEYNGSTSGTFNKTQPQQYYYPAQPTTQPYPNYQSSSSRRGSMTRKTPSPMLDTELIIMECDHMKIRRSQENLNQDFSITYSVNGGTNKSNNSSKVYQFNNSSSSSNNNNNGESLKRLTSFEELAKKSESNSLMYIQQQSNGAQSVDNNPRRYSASNNKPKSDYNIHYKNLNSHDDENDEYAGISHQNLIKKSTSHSYNIRKTERKSSSETNSPFDYDLLKEKRKVDRFMYDDETENKPMETTEKSIKLYDRFFNSEDEEEEEESELRVAKKSSSTKYRSHIISGTEGDDDDENDDENSSNSPPNKSLLSSPIIETIPLLMSGEANASTILYQHPPASSPPSANSSSFRGTSKIPRYHKTSNSNNDSFRKTSSISSPEEEDRSEGLSYNKYESRLAQSFGGGGGGNSFQSPSSTIRSSAGSGTGSSRKNSTAKSDNKIRIKINQKN